MHDNIIKINFSVFQQKYKEKLHKDIPENILSKVHNFNKEFSCFNTHYDPKMIWEKKKITKKEKPFVKQKNRFHIIIPDFTDNSLSKRQLTGLLNKLTDKNKETIYMKIKEIIDLNHDEEYFTLIWSYMKSCENDLYIHILNFFDKTFIDSKLEYEWNKFIDNKGWLPPQYIFENNLLLLNDEYELYCNYVKWKKEINNINYVWIKLNRDVDIILNDIYDYMILYIENKCTEHHNIHKYIVDIFLEQIYRILKYVNNDKIVEKIGILNVNDFENSSRFLIYNILEKK